MADNKTIYLDNAATTIPYKEVLDSYEKVSTSYFANASSVHKLGQESARLLDLSRRQILDLLGLSNTHEVIFTSGATESNNLGIIGYCLAHKNRGKHIITTVYEHPSVLESFKFLETELGFKVTYLDINEKGKVDINNLLNAITNDTILVSIMAVNNEIGTVNDIEKIAKELKGYPKLAFHVDAVQSICKININFKDVDLVTLTSHKIHGPKGVGCLLKKKALEVKALNNGGGQESGFRSGTTSLDLIVAFAKALRITTENEKASFMKVSKLRDLVLNYIKNKENLYEINSDLENPYIINFSLLNKKASVVVEALSNENIMISSISACHSKGEKYSYVVKALNKPEQIYKNTLRVSFDESNTEEEIKIFLDRLDKIVGEVKQ